jgi:hypothetical protein
MGDPGYLARELAFVSHQLKQAADENLRKEFTAAVSKATAQVPAEIRAGLIPRLPDRYVRDDFGPDLKLSVSKRYSARNPGVTVRATTRSGKARKLKRLDRGVLAHPFFGNRRRWFNQVVGPGWFTEPATAAGGRARDEIRQAMDRVATEAMRRGIA